MSTSTSPGKFRKASLTTNLFGNQIYHGQDHVWTNWVCGLLFFDEDIGMDTVRRMTDERILTIPRFRSRYDPKKRGFIELDMEKEMDMDYHLRQIDDVLDLKTIRDDYCGDMYKNLDFDPTKPLWCLRYFPKIEDGRALLLTSICHTVGDGVSQIEIVFRLLDDEVEEGENAPLLKDGAADGKSKAVSSRPSAKRKPPKSFGPLNRTRIFMGGVLGTFVDVFGSTDKRNPLARSDLHKTGPKKTAFTDTIALEKVQELKRKYPGATINDILVAILTLTVNAYFKELEESTGKPAVKKGQKIRASFPINTRKKGEDVFRDGSPHNALAQGSMKFLLNPKSRTACVWTVKRQLDKIKLSPAPLIQKSLGNALFSILPMKNAIKMFTDFASLATAQLSNVAGPKTQAKLGDYKVQDMQFLLSAAVGCYFGLLSYNGNISCGICLDETTSANAEDIAKHWKTEFEQLYEESMKFEGGVPKPKSIFRTLDKL